MVVDHAGVHLLLQAEALEQPADAVGVDQRAVDVFAALPVVAADQQRQQVVGAAGHAHGRAEHRPGTDRPFQLRDQAAQFVGSRPAVGIDGMQAVVVQHEQVGGHRVVAHGRQQIALDLGVVRRRQAPAAEVRRQRADALVALLQQGADIAFEGPRQGGDVLAHLAGAGLVVAVDAPATQADQQHQHQAERRVENQPETLALLCSLGECGVFRAAVHGVPSLITAKNWIVRVHLLLVPPRQAGGGNALLLFSFGRRTQSMLARHSGQGPDRLSAPGGESEAPRRG
ncbi:hypothetical protein D3C76_694930 [compost metagenome]